MEVTHGGTVVQLTNAPALRSRVRPGHLLKPSFMQEPAVKSDSGEAPARVQPPVKHEPCLTSRDSSTKAPPSPPPQVQAEEAHSPLTMAPGTAPGYAPESLGDAASAAGAATRAPAEAAMGAPAPRVMAQEEAGGWVAAWRTCCELWRWGVKRLLGLCACADRKRQISCTCLLAELGVCTNSCPLLRLARAASWLPSPRQRRARRCMRARGRLPTPSSRFQRRRSGCAILSYSPGACAGTLFSGLGRELRTRGTALHAFARSASCATLMHSSSAPVMTLRRVCRLRCARCRRSLRLCPAISAAAPRPVVAGVHRGAPQGIRRARHDARAAHSWGKGGRFRKHISGHAGWVRG